MSALRTVTVKKGIWYESKRSQKTDVRRWEEERRHIKTKETMQK